MFRECYLRNNRFTETHGLHDNEAIEVLCFRILGEQLECQARWRDGSRHFMVGKLNHPHAANDEDKFRCFVYEYKDVERPSEGIYLAQSGDATCNGLFSPREGPRTLKLKKGQ